MQVFLSWSGERSRLVSEETKTWLMCVIQSLKPWMSSDDIGKGTLWFDEISSTLSTSSIGLVFLTRENLSSPWILFESGALANGLSAKRVCTILVDIKPGDVKDPLAQFNHTDLKSKEEMKRLINTINGSLGESALSNNVLDKAFETYWPSYANGIEKIIKNTDRQPEDVDSPVRTDADILREILDTTRNMDKRVNLLESSQSKILNDIRRDTNKIDISEFERMYDERVSNMFFDKFDKDDVNAQLKMVGASAISKKRS